MKKQMILTLSLSAFFTFIIVFDARAQRIELEEWIHSAEAALAGVDSYTAVYHKQERIEGELLKKETIFIKFKKPFKVYMKWIQNPYKGRECLYVAGSNDNRIKAHEGGILRIFKLNLNPRGSRAMKHNRHSITEFGLENVVRIFTREVRRGIEFGELEVKKHCEERVYERTAQKFEAFFPKERGKGYYCQRALIYMDIEKKVPIKIHIYDWEDQIIENYGYEDLRLDAGLTDADFDPKNPEYKF